MKTEFLFERDLVDVFANQIILKDGELLVKELDVRHGNIDVVLIKNVTNSFTVEQIFSLSKPSCALVFTIIKNKRPITFETLKSRVGISESTLKNALYELQQKELIDKSGKCYFRKNQFVFPKTTIIGYEAKLKDFNKAFYQALNNKMYVDYSYIVFPKEIANRILNTKRNLLEKCKIGLIGVSKDKQIVMLKAKRFDDMSANVRLLNIAKAQQLSMIG